MIVSMDPFGGSAFDFVMVGPDTEVSVDEFAFVQADGGFHQGVIECISDGSDGALNVCLAQGFAKRQTCVLRTSVFSDAQARQR